MEELLTVPEVAALLKVSDAQARAIMKKVGEVQGLGRVCRVRPSDLAAYQLDPEAYMADRAAKLGV